MPKSKGARGSDPIKHFKEHHMQVRFQGKNRRKVLVSVSAEPRTKRLQRANSCAGCTTQSVTVTVCPRFPC